MIIGQEIFINNRLYLHLTLNYRDFVSINYTYTFTLAIYAYSIHIHLSPVSVVFLFLQKSYTQFDSHVLLVPHTSRQTPQAIIRLWPRWVSAEMSWNRNGLWLKWGAGFRHEVEIAWDRNQQWPSIGT